MANIKFFESIFDKVDQLLDTYVTDTAGEIIAFITPVFSSLPVIRIAVGHGAKAVRRSRTRGQGGGYAVLAASRWSQQKFRGRNLEVAVPDAPCRAVYGYRARTGFPLLQGKGAFVLKQNAGRRTKSCRMELPAPQKTSNTGSCLLLPLKVTDGSPAPSCRQKTAGMRGFHVFRTPDDFLKWPDGRHIYARHGGRPVRNT